MTRPHYHFFVLLFSCNVIIFLVGASYVVAEHTHNRLTPVGPGLPG